MKSFITGINGFVGHHLTNECVAQGQTVSGCDQTFSSVLSNAESHAINILDTAGLTELFKEIQPDHVYHLAGVSYVLDANATPQKSIEINILGTVSILEAVRHACPQARTLIIGSSKEYGLEQTADPLVDEKTIPNPDNLYGITKYTAEKLALQYVSLFNMDVRCTRSFNHTGSGQSPRFVCSDWGKQIAEIELGLRDPVISVGATNEAIDFLDVRDVASAYRLILQQGSKGEIYNVCSGDPVTLDFILNYLVSKTSRQVTVKTANDRMRQSTARSSQIRGNNGKLKANTGWNRTCTIEQTLDSIFDYWVKELSAKA